MLVMAPMKRKPAALTDGTGVLKRPACATAWHAMDCEKDEEEQNEGEEVVDNEQETKEPGPDGPDSRTTSRSQRYVFKAHRHLIPPEILKEFDHLALPCTKITGKQKRMNEIINEFTSREAKYSDGIVKRMSVEKVTTSAREEKQEAKVAGMAWFTLVGSRFSGSEELANKAWQAGEIKKDPNGKFYVSEHIMTKKKSDKVSIHGAIEFEAPKDAKAFMQLMNGFSEEMNDEPLSIEWADQATSEPITKTMEKKAADDDDFALMQEP